MRAVGWRSLDRARGLHTARVRIDNPAMLTPRPVPEIRQRLLTGLCVFAMLIAFGTAGYMIIERWSFIDALFMTVTTVTTVGYREVRPLDTEGRIFTIVLVLFGVGTAFYLLTTFVALVIEGDLGAAFGLTRMKSRIEQLNDHAVLCGFGRVGEEIAREFVERGVPFVVVENNPDTVPRAVEYGYLLIEGDATKDDDPARGGRAARADAAGGIGLRCGQHVHHADGESAEPEDLRRRARRAA